MTVHYGPMDIRAVDIQVGDKCHWSGNDLTVDEVAFFHDLVLVKALEKVSASVMLTTDHIYVDRPNPDPDVTITLKRSVVEYQAWFDPDHAGSPETAAVGRACRAALR